MRQRMYRLKTRAVFNGTYRVLSALTPLPLSVASVYTRIADHPQRNVLDYLTAACEAALDGEQAPSLLPTPDQFQACMRLAAYLD
jgi:hypothetical protein